MRIALVYLANIVTASFLEFAEACQTTIFVIALALEAITQSSEAYPEWQFTIEQTCNHLAKKVFFHESRHTSQAENFSVVDPKSLSNYKVVVEISDFDSSTVSIAFVINFSLVVI